MQCGCAVRDWRSLHATRSLRRPFARAGIAPDCFALSIVVVVELSHRVRDGPEPDEVRAVHRGGGEYVQV